MPRKTKKNKTKGALKIIDTLNEISKATSIIEKIDFKLLPKQSGSAKN